MELFFASTMDDTSGIDIMKHFLFNEYRVELLELYLFITKHPNFSQQDITYLLPSAIIETVLNQETTFKKRKKETKDIELQEMSITDKTNKEPVVPPQAAEPTNNEKEKSIPGDTKWNRKKFDKLVTVQMVDAFYRLKQTTIFQSEYVEKKELETAFVSKFLTATTLRSSTVTQPIVVPTQPIPKPVQVEKKDNYNTSCDNKV